MMNEHGKSDSPIVPKKLPNKAAEVAEAMEGRGLAKGNLIQRNALRTQSRESVQSGLERMREAVIHGSASAPLPKARARCVSSARRDPCGGCRATGIPTATLSPRIPLSRMSDPLP